MITMKSRTMKCRKKMMKMNIMSPRLPQLKVQKETMCQSSILMTKLHCAVTLSAEIENHLRQRFVQFAIKRVMPIFGVKRLKMEYRDAQIAQVKKRNKQKRSFKSTVNI